MKISGIYQIQSLCKPERIYIGSAVYIVRRWSEHLSELRRNIHSNSKLQNHFNKYSESDLQFSVLLGCEKEELIKNEQFFIDSYNPWFNINKIAGSTLGYKYSQEAIDKIKKTRSERQYIVTEETRNKIRDANSGEKNYNFGKHLTDEQKKNISIKNSGNKYCVGRVLSEETKKKISSSLMGIGKGKKKSAETRERMRIAQRIRFGTQNKEDGISTE